MPRYHIWPPTGTYRDQGHTVKDTLVAGPAAEMTHLTEAQASIIAFALNAIAAGADIAKVGKFTTNVLDVYDGPTDGVYDGAGPGSEVSRE